MNALAKSDDLRQRPLFFEYRAAQQRGVCCPSLPTSMRHGKWKLFASQDFEHTALYDVVSTQQNRGTSPPTTNASSMNCSRC